MCAAQPHPLDGTYFYLDSHLALKVDPESEYRLHDFTLSGRFSFAGEYGLVHNEVSYQWPVLGGTVNEVAAGTYQVAFLILAPPRSFGELEAAGLTSFVDAFAGFGTSDKETGRVEVLQLRFVNTTYCKDLKGWARFKWLPSFEGIGARSYVRSR